MSVDYTWFRYDQRLYCLQGDVVPIQGSSRYLEVTFNSQTRFYSVLLDVDTNTISDPLAALDNEVLEKIKSVTFSPNGRTALIGCSGNDPTLLLNCETGEVTNLSELTGLYVDLDMCFVDANTVLLLSKSGELTTAWLYDLKSTKLTQTCSTTEQITFHGARYATYVSKQNVTILNLMSGTESVAQLPVPVDRVMTCGSNQFAVVTKDQIFRISWNGNYSVIDAVKSS